MYERFTDRARKVMQLANQEAQRFNHEYIGTEHVLLGLIKEGSGVAANVLKNLDVDLRKIRLEVEKLGFVPAESMAAQVGLDSHILLLRRITINPGGQIAKHSAASTPGVVYMESGTWTEGRDSGETEHSAGDTFIEDKDTVHWFYNRGTEPAAA